MSVSNKIKIPMALGSLALAVVGLSGCHGGASNALSGSTSPSSSPLLTVTARDPMMKATASNLAREIKDSDSAVTSITVMTAATDPNHLLGRPTGYTSAAVLHVAGAACSGAAGVGCGATVEVWDSNARAVARAKYIQTILGNAPALGSEYDYASGPDLLRISGTLTPTQADALDKTIGGTLVKG